MIAARKDTRELIQAAKALGFSCSQTGSGHLRFDHPRVSHPVFSPKTPRTRGFDNKAFAKMRTALRRAEA